MGHNHDRLADRDPGKHLANLAMGNASHSACGRTPRTGRGDLPETLAVRRSRVRTAAKTQLAPRTKCAEQQATSLRISAYGTQVTLCRLRFTLDCLEQ